MTPGLIRVCWVAVAWTSLGLLGCDEQKPKQEPVVEAPPRPTVGEGGACKSSEDCGKGLACAPDNTCQSPKTIDCRGRAQACKEDGRCYGRDNKCVPRSTEDCKKSTRCETDGHCTAKDDACVADSEQDCKALCDMYGRCTLKDGDCIAEKDSDCRKSSACQTAKRCNAYKGRCVGR